MKQRRWILAGLGLFALLVPLVIAHEALARPGGGQSYSSPGRRSGGGGGGGGGSHSSGDGGGEVVYIVFRLLLWCFENPAPGLPILAAVGAGAFFFWRASRAQKTTTEWTAGAMNRMGSEAAQRPIESVRAQMESVRQQDKDFSLVLFEDFLYALFTRVHEARGGQRLRDVMPYLTSDVAAMLGSISSPSLERVDAIVIGAMKYTHMRAIAGSNGQPGSHEVSVRFQSNYTEHAQGGRQAFYADETWTLRRAANVRSRPMDRARVIECPNCGGALKNLQGNTCPYCSVALDTGQFDWRVVRVDIAARTIQAPRLGGPDAPEMGNELPTVVAGDFRARMGNILAADGGAWDGLTARVPVIFHALQTAWSTQQWERARPFVSDQLFAMQQYWLTAYRSAGLRNITEKSSIIRLLGARAMSDRTYDSVTLRVFAQGLDYTLDAKDRVVSGSKRKSRAYTEYWTLIRCVAARGKPAQDAPVEAQKCPSCGAPLKVNMGGGCEYCGAHVTAGEFDWVLSRIEQDDDYEG